MMASLSAQTGGAAQDGDNGNASGFDQAQPEQQLPGDQAWDNDAFFTAIFREPTFRNHGPGFMHGFRAGYEDGRSDIEDGEQAHFGYRFRYPDHYRLQFGDKDDYVREYQDGYKRGYQRGYAAEV